MSLSAVLISFLIALVALRGIQPSERPYILLLIAAHVACAFGQVLLFEDYYGYGDIEGMVIYGKILAQLMEVDPVRFVPEVVKLVLHMSNGLPVQFVDTTGTMVGLTGLVMFLVGPVKTGSCLVVSMFSMVGQLSLYKQVRELVADSERRVVLLGTLFAPSVVFWSSGLQKEAIAVGFLGFACSGAIVALLRRKVLTGSITAVVGATGVGLIKPYILFPFVLGFGAWFFAASFKDRKLTLRGIVYIVAAFAVAIAGVLVLGRLFPSFSVDTVGSTAAGLQHAGEGMQTANDSYVAIGDASEKTLAGQGRFFPLALFNTLFRPVIFEVRGPVILAAALEMSVLTVLLLRVLARLRDPRVRSTIRNSPMVVFCVAFVVTFGIGVGIATTNMGTLARYRMPMMPFYVTSLLLVHRRTSKRALDEVDETEAAHADETATQSTGETLG